MVATTDQKARLLDLVTGVLELTRDGNRDAGEVADVFQIIKDDSKFARRLLSLDGELITTFPIWKIVKLGTTRGDGKSLKRLLEQNGFRIGDRARDIMNQQAFRPAKEETEIQLVKLSVAELGFSSSKGATYGVICDRARELGLDLCPAEVGPQLRLQYSDQPRHERLAVAMKPITGSDGYLRLFDVGHVNGGRWLAACWGNPGDVWLGRDQFVFLSK